MAQVSARVIVRAAMLAAAYAALVTLLAPISFLGVQVRVANALIGLVPLLGMPGAIGITLGVVIGNVWSPLGPLDMLSAVPTFASLTILLRLRDRSVLAGLLIYTGIVSAWVGFLLSYVLGVPFVLTFPYLLVGIGIATALLGYIVYRAAARVLPAGYRDRDRGRQG